jgi:c-di-GMP-binding flagellar brake protein YcgR
VTDRKYRGYSMLSDVITVGDKIDVKQLDHAGGLVKMSKTYVSQLLDINDEKTISIAMPYGNGLLFILEQGKNYRLCFYTSKGLYQCNCVMSAVYRENNALIASVKLTTTLDKIQRRQYYRLECIHEIEYRTITQEELQLENKLATNKFINTEEKADVRRRLSQLDRAWLKASITDLSGGGARFNSDEPLQTGDRIRIRLDFIMGNELKKLVVGAEIIISGKMENRNDKYEHRAEFYDIGKVDREDLIKYIFEQERRRRRNDKV